ncbi:unnamed protein product [Didymodactylos carnosus]|uniref:Uncharacterized protein n=1 Tax=Didymodactylos carnosus TaxID=1234261 RepID=A0A814QVQ6_9BILA|nr:unnamed protein product [Didymodactylos carnosus]CAF3886897.1 unnamed protein product [Didymodactylos carnosus]
MIGFILGHDNKDPPTFTFGEAQFMLTAEDVNGFTPLLTVVYHNNLVSFLKIFKVLRANKNGIEAYTKTGSNVLHICCENKNSYMIRLLGKILQQTTFKHMLDERNQNGNTPADMTIKNRNKEILNQLYVLQNNDGKKGIIGQLHAAVMIENSLETVKYLLKKQILETKAYETLRDDNSANINGEI